MATPANIPLIQVRNLPVYTGTLDANASVLAVVNNSTTARVPYTSVTAGFLTVSPTVPTTPQDAGANNQITWDYTDLQTHDMYRGDLYNSGVYTYAEGWGKSPRYTTHWDDLQADVRCMLVNKPMRLNNIEIGNVLETIGSASTTREGVVQLATDINAQNTDVPTAKQVAAYVDQTLQDAGVDMISNYSGEVNLKDAVGNNILSYNPTTKELVIGNTSVEKVIFYTNTGVEYYDARSTNRAAIDTHNQ